jgi:hypothetical protein
VTTLRRFLILAALMFWQGGFTFYAAVVVPVGQQTLGSESQSQVTRRVTNYLNLAGVAALPILAWDIWSVQGAGGSRRVWRWTMWSGMTSSMALLIWLHLRLDAILDRETKGGFDPQVFYTNHRLYLWTSTLQWAFAVAYGVLSLAAWRQADGTERPGMLREWNVAARKEGFAQKKSSVADSFGVAQSPKSPRDGTT